MKPLVFNLSDCGKPASIDFYGDKIEATDGGDAAAEWFTEYLGEETRLTVNPEGRDVSKTNWIPEKNGKALDWRLKGIEYMKTDNFSNHYPIQLISQDSVDDVNKKLPANRDKISHWNFRSNIIVKTLKNEPWEEDKWIGRLHIGDCIIAMARESLRCPLITVDKEEITVCQEDEPTKTLKTFRKINPRDVPFLAERKLCKIPAGTDHVIVKEGEIRVGDPIYLEQVA
ncbi:Oidioi.mRNA.OKI2018_I69.PAR.g9186.t1.cds [Oikopleura dioica]|uniref:Oidioi.mRNA.OKI2018_I69.PAR.g9186.t1.cds n=1 Tax=Oikopleura dioica TaxID=34765 RepID=A0ABN7RKE6_OIKDI|nr:Oidioi.mRNA.OKI2018_I69.PAR.g9186.t1.cds [Oikopleura dioica]